MNVDLKCFLSKGLDLEGDTLSCLGSSLLGSYNHSILLWEFISQSWKSPIVLRHKC